MATILGIDLGSSLCRTAVFRDGKVESFPNRFSERKLPVIVEAVDGAVSFTSIKQGLGFSESGGAAELFRALRQDAKEATGEDIDAAVATVPACFTERQRAALRQAAVEGGFDAVRLLDESMAALLATTIKPDKKTVLVYALGAGVFSASMFQMGGSAPRALWHEGNRSLGGNNFDAAIVALLLERLGFTPQQFIDPQESAEKLKQLAENVKVGLSKRASEEFDVNVGELFADAGRKGHFSVGVGLTRSDLDGAIAGMIEETIELARRAVEGAAVEPAKIDAIVLVGDSTRIPLVEKRLREEYAAEFVRASSGAIARGAATHGSQLDEKAWERERSRAVPVEEAPTEETISPDGWGGQFAPGFDRAHKLWQAGEQDMAIAAVERVIMEIPKFLAKLYVTRGEHMLREGNLDGALDHFEKGLKFDRNDRSTQKLYHRACNLKARDLVDKRRFIDAKAYIRKGAQYVPNCEGCAQLLLRIEKEDRTGSHKRRR